MKKKRRNKNKHKYNEVNVYKKLKEEKIFELERKINILKNNKLKKKKLINKYYKIVRIILIIIFLSLIIYSSYKLLHFKKELIVIEEEKQEIIEEVIKIPLLEEKEEKIEDIKIDFNKLKEINNDTIGWIIFNKKYINNPLVKTNNNEYYLNKSFKGVENSIGTLFIDYRNNSLEDQNVIIFGHNTPNNSMFGSLSDVFSSEFWNEDNDNLIYIFDINNNVRKYKIFSYYVIESEEYYITPNFNTIEEFNIFINTMKRRSFKKIDIEVTSKDKILTLSTCAGPSGTTKRRVIHAKLLD